MTRQKRLHCMIEEWEKPCPHPEGKPLDDDSLRGDEELILGVRKTPQGMSLSETMFGMVPSLIVVVLCLGPAALSSTGNYSRKDFPPGFVFGAGTSAYQVEGAANEDGRGPSVWDTFCHQGYAGGNTGDVAADEYHKYKEDVKLMVETGLDAYRFSISWSRLIPNGRGQINPKGLQYYNNLIDELTRHGIQPHVTLLNYDQPQSLEDEYGGWLNKKIVKDFAAYADVCFREFGDRVSHWATINEPNVFAIGGYDNGVTPPHRCSPTFGFNCSKGNSSYEPYLAAHHMLLAHASAARLYHRQYQGKQHGFIGISFNAYWFFPLTNSIEDVMATQRAMDFYLGWTLNPLVFGDYPNIMKKRVGSRLPTFTAHESKLVKGSFDFLGILHYASFYIYDNPSGPESVNKDFIVDASVNNFLNQFDTSAIELPVRPWGLQAVLEYLKQAYGNPPIYIYENGQFTLHNSPLEDTSRVRYLRAYTGSLLDAIRNGSNARGYFVWSFVDLFELLTSYGTSYGLYSVDFNDPHLKRRPKQSAHWYSQFLKGQTASSSIEEKLQLEKNVSSV